MLEKDKEEKAKVDIKIKKGNLTKEEAKKVMEKYKQQVSTNCLYFLVMFNFFQFKLLSLFD